jgi:general secretion pathway protein G
MKRPIGFSMVEILMVLAILGLIATIVVPNFTQASEDARLGSLCEDLQLLRSQIALYAAQHEERPPSFSQFRRQLTETTDVNGVPSGGTQRAPKAEPPVIFGPYLKRIPVNPFNGRTDETGQHGAIDDATAGPSVGDDGGSWEYDETTGNVWADDGTDADGDGKPDHARL